MKFTTARSPATKLSPAAFCFSWALITVFIIMISLQLMTFEKFAPIIQNYQLFDNLLPAKILAAGIVTLEIVALPFLLRMTVSHLLRIISAASLLIASLTWLSLGIWIQVAHPPLSATGVVGGLLPYLSPAVVLPYGALLFTASLVAIYVLRRDLKL